MKNKTLWILWACLYTLCVALGIISQPDALLQTLMTLIAVAFFVPGGILLYRGIRTGNRMTVGIIRILAGSSLVLTLLTLVGIFLSVNGGEELGVLLQGVLVLVSAPMLCARYWVLSLFLWACLLIGSFCGKKGQKT